MAPFGSQIMVLCARWQNQFLLHCSAMSKITFAMILGWGLMGVGFASDLKMGDKAPHFKVLDHEGKSFDLNDRKGKWTILYFYPKADTPGCTKQACAFRDSLSKIRSLNADVFGISTDSVESIAKFHQKHHLNFKLLSDENLEVTKKYGTKMPVIAMSKRWTFLIGPELTLLNIDTDVEPVKDAEKMALAIQGF